MDPGADNPGGGQNAHVSANCPLLRILAQSPKYNPIERRLFSAISRNWAGEPLQSYEKILKFIRTTTTTTGLKVRAFLDRRDYPLGAKPSASRMREIRITRHHHVPRWNYTIRPSTVK
ncbi:MAG: hypothetical protein DMG57_30455 [Acidobacteria bacterium]|nr:MAG: hypothetical protein DMG57_30455 [Acidobacteriota bacterium]